MSEKPITDFYPRFASSQVVIKALRSKFPGGADEILQAMAKSKEFPVGLSDAHNTIDDLVDNDAKAVEKDEGMGSASGTFGITIYVFEGAYFVRAAEFGDLGFFSSFEEAQEAMWSHYSPYFESDRDETE